MRSAALRAARGGFQRVDSQRQKLAGCLRELFDPGEECFQPGLAARGGLAEFLDVVGDRLQMHV